MQIYLQNIVTKQSSSNKIYLYYYYAYSGRNFIFSLINRARGGAVATFCCERLDLLRLRPLWPGLKFQLETSFHNKHSNFDNLFQNIKDKA